METMTKAVHILVEEEEIMCIVHLMKKHKSMSALSHAPKQSKKSGSTFKQQPSTAKGMVFGKWQVVGEAEPLICASRARPRVMCKCSCRKQTTRAVSWWDLVYGKSTNCGCAPKTIIHGFNNHPMKHSRRHMIDRCTNPKCREWKWYGGRILKPVTICKEWIDSPASFYRDMGPTWKQGLTLDRRDNLLGYFKENCRWITRKEQQRNKLNNRPVLAGGKPMILVQAAELVGICRHKLRKILNKEGFAMVNKTLISDLSFQQ